MSCSSPGTIDRAGRAFDRVAERYDEIFTETVIGRAQRAAVWDEMARLFQAGDRVLELNCGTGEDALFLARRGVAVEACDASAQMIEVAQRRKKMVMPESTIEFRRLATEQLAALGREGSFDGVLSNFAGLNCVPNLRRVAANLSRLTRPGANVLLCFLSRVCLWELIWFSARGEFRKAARRVRGSATAQLSGHAFPLWYPTIRQIKQAFAPWFDLRSVRAVGLLVPPSYLEFWASRHPGFIRSLGRMERSVGAWLLLRGFGDHVLLRFMKVGL
jgi:ubiquinone/menaquinone biosynthesis C-methylase UbiE